MTDDIRCDDHVGEPFAPRCDACALERKVAELLPPEGTELAVVSTASLEADSAALLAQWTSVPFSPDDVVTSITELIKASDPVWAGLVTQLTFHNFTQWLQADCPEAQVHTRSAFVFPAVRMLRMLRKANDRTTPRRTS